MEQIGRLGEFEAMVLATVIRAGDQANGVAVFEGLTATSGQTVSLPAVHVTLRRLEDKGLLTSEVGTPSDRGGRPRRFYRATPAGVRAAAQFREMWRRVWRGLALPDAESTK
jgi:DNA-binding PadR family transcriptional regulator